MGSSASVVIIAPFRLCIAKVFVSKATFLPKNSFLAFKGQLRNYPMINGILF